METYIENISRWADKSEAKRCLQLLSKIVDNVRRHPDDEKYRHLSYRHLPFARMVEQHDECVGILEYLGFREGEEKWIIDDVDSEKLTKFTDVSTSLHEHENSIIVRSVSEPPSSYQIAKKRMQEHKQQVEEILHQAEQDRIESQVEHDRYIETLRGRIKRPHRK